MRHLKKGRKFGRVRKVRKSFLSSLLRALILKGRIVSTEARAKEMRPRVEKLITKAKKGTLASRRELLRVLDKESVGKLFAELAPLYRERPGGYTRILKLGPRKSDGAKMAIIEFVR